jgi:hypothetical protein
VDYPVWSIIRFVLLILTVKIFFWVFVGLLLFNGADPNENGAS